jgi:hypothetical protein
MVEMVAVLHSPYRSPHVPIAPTHIARLSPVTGQSQTVDIP